MLKYEDFVNDLLFEKQTEGYFQEYNLEWCPLTEAYPEVPKPHQSSCYFIASGDPLEKDEDAVPVSDRGSLRYTFPYDVYRLWYEDEPKFGDRDLSNEGKILGVAFCPYHRTGRFVGECIDLYHKDGLPVSNQHKGKILFEPYWKMYQSGKKSYADVKAQFLLDLRSACGCPAKPLRNLFNTNNFYDWNIVREQMIFRVTPFNLDYVMPNTKLNSGKMELPYLRFGDLMVTFYVALGVNEDPADDAGLLDVSLNYHRPVRGMVYRTYPVSDDMMRCWRVTPEELFAAAQKSMPDIYPLIVQVTPQQVSPWEYGPTERDTNSDLYCLYCPHDATAGRDKSETLSPALSGMFYPGLLASCADAFFEKHREKLNLSEPPDLLMVSRDTTMLYIFPDLAMMPMREIYANFYEGECDPRAINIDPKLPNIYRYHTKTGDITAVDPKRDYHAEVDPSLPESSLYRKDTKRFFAESPAVYEVKRHVR